MYAASSGKAMHMATSALSHEAMHMATSALSRDGRWHILALTWDARPSERFCNAGRFLHNAASSAGV